MELILREDVPKLGDKGDIVNVRAGYARNYLLPRRLAILATDGTRKQVEAMRAAAGRKAAREKGAAEELAAQLAELELVFTKRAGDQGQLFGSVTASDIADAVAEKGFTIDRRRLELSEPLKHIGDFTVELRLHREVTAGLKVMVAADGVIEAPPPPEVAAPPEEETAPEPAADEPEAGEKAEAAGEEPLPEGETKEAD